MKATTNFIMALAAVVLIVGGMSIFTVDQTRFALVFQLGQVKTVITEPGLYFKWPFIENIKFLDKRILTLDAADPERFITSEKNNVLVDSYVKWRILDPKLYYVSVDGKEDLARIRIAQTVNAGLREEFGKRTVHDVVSGERDQIMEEMRRKANEDTQKIGVHIVDVRIKRVDFPNEVSESVYSRMEAERKRAANESRSEGAAAAEQIRANAEAQKTVILARAYRDAQKTKGEGDAKAAEIYAEAFNKSPEFYDFYRSMEAYRKSFESGSNFLVVGPDSKFFQYMKSPDSVSSHPR